MRLIRLLICIYMSVTGFTFLQAGDTYQLLDGIEEGNNWEWQSWSDYARLKTSADICSEGDYSLKVSFTPENRRPNNKGIFIKTPVSGTPDQLKKIIVDIYNDTDSGEVSLALALDAEEFYEAPQVALKKGWNRDIEFDLLKSDFKSAGSGWDYRTSLKKDVGLGDIMFIFYLGSVQYGDFYMDNVRTGRIRSTSSGKGKKKDVPGEYSPPRIISVEKNNDTVQLYDLFELTVRFSGSCRNPFDPSEIQVTGYFTSPEKKQAVVAGFLYSGDVQEGSVEDPVWKIRFSPGQKGLWTYDVRVRNLKGEDRSEKASMKCAGPDRDGFIRVDDKYPGLFRFDSGKNYYPIGHNVCWASVEEYERYFSRLSQSKENWSRVWLVNWNVGLEWKNMGYFRGLNNYNLENARKLDRIVELAGKNGIYLQLVFDFHGAFSTGVNPEWQNNPYNVRNGGPCPTARDFFINKKARELYKKRVQYIISRWAYSTHVLAWELFNEVNFTDSFDKDIDTRWHKEMSGFIKQIDPFRHMVTTSYYKDYNKNVLGLDTIDYSQVHNYDPGVFQMMKSLPLAMKEFKKPFFFAEFGCDSKDGIEDLDKAGVFIHAGLWVQYMTESGGNAMPWWWNTHIEPNNLYHHFKALAEFDRGLDRREHDFRPITGQFSGQSEKGTVTLELTGLKDDKLILFWLCDAKGMRFKERDQALVIRNSVVTLGDMKNKVYSVEFWDTYKGVMIKKIGVKASADGLKISMPDFRNDMACKIKVATGL
ncbi:MAG: DUF5060 domain-containing protein [bacterium]|nr:DUF5060 domain-containing protein [bacterium]